MTGYTVTQRYLPPGFSSPHLDYPKHSTLGDVLAGAAKQFPAHIALRDGEIELTYRELHDRALRVAGGLKELGIRERDVVALHLPNSAWFTVGYYGVLLAGATVTAMNPAFPPAPLAAQLAESGARAVLTHASIIGALPGPGESAVDTVVLVPPTAASAYGGAPSTTAWQPTPFERLLEAAPADRAAITPDDLAHLSFTGGTTGIPKAVQVTHRNLVSNICQGASWRTGHTPYTDEEHSVLLRPLDGAVQSELSRLGTNKQLMIAPFYHAMGMVSQSLSVVQGAEVNIFGRFDAAGFLREVSRLRVTQLNVSPALCHALLAVPGAFDLDLDSVNYLASGASPIESDTLKQLERLFPKAIVLEAYGMTESTLSLTLGSFEGRGITPVGSVGQALFDTELSIRSPEDTSVLPNGEIGEIWARGPQITSGYKGHPELTALQFTEDGWLRTGDLGRLDDEGWLYVSGRMKDMLIYKGYNVYPLQLEEVMIEHPVVRQVSVVGVPKPGVGEIPVAFVVLHDGAAGTDDLVSELRHFVAERVVPYSQVRDVRFIDELPVTATGKVLKTELRDRYEAEPHAEPIPTIVLKIPGA